MARGQTGRGRNGTPSWAIGVAEQVAARYKLDWEVDVRWRTDRTGKYYSSGVTVFTMGDNGSYNKYVTVTAGSDKLDQAAVVLHELAHVISPQHESHGPRFWRTCFELFTRYELPLEYCFYRSAHYRAGAVEVAYELYDIPDAWLGRYYKIMTGKMSFPKWNLSTWEPRYPWRDLLELD